MTQAYTKIPGVNTEQPIRTQDNISQSEEGFCKWETLVDTENSLCTQGNLCIDTTSLGFLCQLVSWVLFQLRKLLLRQEPVLYIYSTMNLKTSNFLKTKFTCLVHIYISCSILRGTSLQGKVLSVFYQAINFIHFELWVMWQLSSIDSFC